MTTLDDIVDATNEIEQWLMKLGGEGRGMHEKLSSVRVQLPQDLIRQIRYIATARNRRMHESRDAISDPQAFVSTCGRASARLRDIHASRLAAQKPRPPTATPSPAVTIQPIPTRPAYVKVREPVRPFMAQLRALVGPVVAAIGFAAVAGYFVHGMFVAEPKAVEMVAKAPIDKAKSSQAVADGSKSNGKAEKKKPSAKSEQRRESARPKTDTLRASATPSTSKADLKAKGSEVPEDAQPLQLKNPRLEISSSVFDPVIINVSVTNNTGKTLSGAYVAAKLFINGEEQPVGTPGSETEKLYAYFGANGLAAGRTTRVKLTPKKWDMPDVVNAKVRRLEVGVVELIDGSKNRSSVTFPFVVSETGSMISTPQRGEGVRTGGDIPGIEKPTFDFGGTFGDPQVTATIVNRTGVTLSLVKVAARLYVDGSAHPVVVKTGTSRPVMGSFGRQGLKPGQKRVVKMSISDYSWDTPDIRNAKSLRIELGILGYWDGKNRNVEVASDPSKIIWN